MDETPLADESWKHHRDNLKRCCATSVSAMKSCTSEDFTFALIPLPLTTSVTSSSGCRRSIGTEMYPVFYKDELPRDETQQRSENSMSGKPLPHPYRHQVVHQARTDKETIRLTSTRLHNPCMATRSTLPLKREQGVLCRFERNGCHPSGLS